MKKILISILLITAGIFSSCTQMLMEESKTSVTTQWLTTTPEGLDRMMTGLYVQDRDLIKESEGEYFGVLMLDYCTDLMVMRGGKGANLARLNGLTPENVEFSKIWAHYYQLVGKANILINNAAELGLEIPEVQKVWAEAKVMRARSYFELFKRFDRIYLNTESTSVDNLEREFRPAPEEDVLSQIRTDLDEAVPALPWTDLPGRYTKAVALHIRAQVAMWECDWDKAAACCEEIFACSDYAMMNSAADCFKGADLNCKENLYVYQFSENIGGGNTIESGQVVGHKIAMTVTPTYNKIAGLKFSAEYGGYGWGRVYPNSYLLGLYDQVNDKRYQELFRLKWYYNDEDTLPSGKMIGDEVRIPSGKDYLTSLHPMTLKYFDGWTNATNLERRSSYKDIVLYRLAETYLMAAEAYYHKEGPGSAKAHEYYNKTWKRAGNDEYTAPLSMEVFLDEYARELHMEGVRWSLLKRLGLLDRVQLYGGDTRADDPLLDANANVDQQRHNYLPKHNTWPIPQVEIDVMGADNFPQNPGW